MALRRCSEHAVQHKHVGRRRNLLAHIIFWHTHSRDPCVHDAEERAMRNTSSWHHANAAGDDGAALAGIAAGVLAAVLLATGVAIEQLVALLQSPLGVLAR
jgi:hypothetical protein